MTVLDAPVATRLGECEAIIARGQKAFVDVGNALLVIRDERLYRETHATFEDYCRERWQLSESRAYQLMDGAKTSTVVEVRNEAQARELAGLDDDVKREVVAAAIEKTGGKLTSPAIRDAREEIAPRGPKVIPADEWREENETPAPKAGQPKRHEIFGKAHHIDTNRILRETVTALEGARIGLGLIRYDQADPAEKAQWSESLRATARELNRVAKELEK